MNAKYFGTTHLFNTWLEGNGDKEIVKLFNDGNSFRILFRKKPKTKTKTFDSCTDYETWFNELPRNCDVVEVKTLNYSSSNYYRIIVIYKIYDDGEEIVLSNSL